WISSVVCAKLDCAANVMPTAVRTASPTPLAIGIALPSFVLSSLTHSRPPPANPASPGSSARPLTWVSPTRLFPRSAEDPVVPYPVPERGKIVPATACSFPQSDAIHLVPRGPCVWSGLSLHRLQEGQDLADGLLAQRRLPRRHAIGGPAFGDRRVEHPGHVLAVAPPQTAQIRPRIRIHGVGRVAVGAVDVEEAPPLVDHGAIAAGRRRFPRGRHRRLVRRDQPGDIPPRLEGDRVAAREPVPVHEGPDLDLQVLERAVEAGLERVVSLLHADRDTRPCGRGGRAAAPRLFTATGWGARRRTGGE